MDLETHHFPLGGKLGCLLMGSGRFHFQKRSKKGPAYKNAIVGLKGFLGAVLVQIGPQTKI